jgi:FkbM family methyltransferase
MLDAVGAMVDLIWTHPANRGRRLRTLAKSAAWQLYKRTIRQPFTITRYGLAFRCHSDSGDAARMIYFNGFPDPQEMAFCERYLRSGDNVIDAGANVGLYTLFFASLVQGGRILAFEPDPTAARRLRENVHLNGLANVTVKQAALSDFTGNAAFSTGADEGNAFYDLKTYGRPSQMVEATTLDSEIADSYALCKMDVEGAEMMALQGAAESLAAHNPPVLLIELSERIQARSGRTVADIQSWLAERGYELWRFEDSELVPFMSMDRKPGKVGDGNAIASAKLGMVKERLHAVTAF